MMVRKARIGMGMLALGLALTLVPTVTASAAVEKSAVCQAYAKDVNTQTKGSTALAKQLESGNWATAQKALLKALNNEQGAEKDFQGFLSGAPAKVKAASNVALGLVSQFRSIVQSSTSLEQFGSRITSATESPKVSAALAVLTNYAKKLHCGINGIN
jgi:hypothetical protein